MLIREIADTGQAARFDGEPMVQSFSAGDAGYVWITTAEAMTVPAFGCPWVAARLAEREAELGPRAFRRALRDGLRLRVEQPELALAA